MGRVLEGKGYARGRWRWWRHWCVRSHERSRRRAAPLPSWMSTRGALTRQPPGHPRRGSRLSPSPETCRERADVDRFVGDAARPAQPGRLGDPVMRQPLRVPLARRGSTSCPTKTGICCSTSTCATSRVQFARPCGCFSNRGRGGTIVSVGSDRRGCRQPAAGSLRCSEGGAGRAARPLGRRAEYSQEGITHERRHLRARSPPRWAQAASLEADLSWDTDGPRSVVRGGRGGNGASSRRRCRRT